jgi:hypothetical protein
MERSYRIAGYQSINEAILALNRKGDIYSAHRWSQAAAVSVRWRPDGQVAVFFAVIVWHYHIEIGPELIARDRLEAWRVSYCWKRRRISWRDIGCLRLPHIAPPGRQRVERC